ncbi:MAG TPA: glutathione S-transferase N-terminal domain-containing protein [Nannocystis sp.]
MKVYGHPASTCTRKVLTTLAEKNHTADFVMIDIMKGEGHTPEYLARQPWGQVPVLEEDDGWQLFESRAIIRHLDATLPGPALTPANARDRARMEQWISIESANFTPGVMKILGQLLFAKWRGEEPKMTLVEEGRASVRKAVAVMEKTLAEHEYIAGKEFTLADIGFMPYIEYLFVAGEGNLITDNPNTSAWWNRISERASWQQVRGKSSAA